MFFQCYFIPLITVFLYIFLLSSSLHGLQPGFGHNHWRERERESHFTVPASKDPTEALPVSMTHFTQEYNNHPIPYQFTLAQHPTVAPHLSMFFHHSPCVVLRNRNTLFTLCMTNSRYVEYVYTQTIFSES